MILCGLDDAEVARYGKNCLIKGAQPGVVMINVLYSTVITLDLIGSANPDQSLVNVPGSRTSLSTMLATTRLAKHFSAARVIRPARYISSSSARHSDALFVVCLLRCS